MEAPSQKLDMEWLPPNHAAAQSTEQVLGARTVPTGRVEDPGLGHTCSMISDSGFCTQRY